MKAQCLVQYNVPALQYSLHKSKNCHFFLVTKHTVVGLWGPTHSGSYTVDKQWLKPPYPAPR